MSSRAYPTNVTISVGGTPTITHASGTTTINSLTSDEKLVLSGGSISIAAASTVNDSFTVSGGTLTGAGTLTVTSIMVWSSGGTMSGSDSTIIQSGATLTLSAGTSTLDTRTLDNSGTITWTGGTFYLNNSAVLNNLSGALFDMQSNNLLSWSVGLAGTFNNTGTIRKSAGGTTSTVADTFNNTGGTIEGQSGTLSFTGDGTHTGGTYTVSSGATVTHSAVHSFSGSFSGTISGTLQTTGTFTATGGGASFNFIGNGLTLPGSTLNGTTFTNDGIITLSTGTHILDTATLNNNGTMTWTAGTFYLNNSAVLNNQSGSLFDLTSDNTLSWSAGTAGTINNSGTFRKSAGTGTSSIDDPFNNTGTASRSADPVPMLFTLSGGTSTGAFDVSSGALLNYQRGFSYFQRGSDPSRGGSGSCGRGHPDSK